ncbi:hypothetical protein, partial [Gordonibacter faecis]
FAACRGEQRKEILYSPVSLLSRTFFKTFEVFSSDCFETASRSSNLKQALFEENGALSSSAGFV